MSLLIDLSFFGVFLYACYKFHVKFFVSRGALPGICQDHYDRGYLLGKEITQKKLLSQDSKVNTAISDEILQLIKKYHPDRNKTLCPNEVTASLNSLRDKCK